MSAQTPRGPVTQGTPGLSFGRNAVDGIQERRWKMITAQTVMWVCCFHPEKGVRTGSIFTVRTRSLRVGDCWFASPVWAVLLSLEICSLARTELKHKIMLSFYSAGFKRGSSSQGHVTSWGNMQEKRSNWGLVLLFLLEKLNISGSPLSNINTQMFIDKYNIKI